MIYESWHFEIAFNFLAQLHLVDFDVQFCTSHATLKGFAYDIVLALIVFIKLPYFSSYDHALCEMNPTCKNDYDSHNMFEGKCTNVSCSIFLIHCAWAWCSSHSNSIFFTWLIIIISLHGDYSNANIHEIMVLSFKPTKANRYLDLPTYIWNLCLVQMLMK